VLGIPLNHHRAVPLTYDQFRYAFANAVEEDEAQQLYKEFAVPASGTPLFQAATANLNPWTQAKADYKNPDRGHDGVIGGKQRIGAAVGQDQQSGVNGVCMPPVEPHQDTVSDVLAYNDVCNLVCAEKCIWLRRLRCPLSATV
jgi:hypothetical protein